MTTHLLVAAAPQAPSAFVQLMPMVLILLVFYFILWRPMSQRRKTLEAQIAELKKGDRVVTNGGLYGEVVKTDDRTLILKLAENVKVKVAKSAIAGLEGSPEDQGAN
ncbi:MAG: preprotein translocase subunit YajC [Acidobacteriota bacterium]